MAFTINPTNLLDALAKGRPAPSMSRWLAGYADELRDRAAYAAERAESFPEGGKDWVFRKSTSLVLDMVVADLERLAYTTCDGAYLHTLTSPDGIDITVEDDFDDADTEAPLAPSPNPGHCECPDSAWDHAKGRCEGRWLTPYARDGVVLWLCPNCSLSGDVSLDPDDDDDDDEGEIVTAAKPEWHDSTLRSPNSSWEVVYLPHPVTGLWACCAIESGSGNKPVFTEFGSEADAAMHYLALFGEGWRPIDHDQQD